MSLVVWLPLTKDTRQQGLSNISVTGSPASWGNGKLGKCATWNGAVANVLYNNTTDFNYTNNFSVAFWANPVYTGSTAQYAWTVGRADAGGYGYGFQITSTTAGNFRFGNGSYSVSAPSNEWHHFAMTIGNSKVTIYKDGIQVSSNNLPGTIPTYSDGNGMGLGCFHYSGNIYPYYGSLNDFRIYDHCLSPMEVKELAKGLVLHYPLNRQGWGQENLVTGSNTNSNSNAWGHSNASGSVSRSIVVENGIPCVKLTRGSDAQSSWHYFYYSNLLRNQIKTNTTYTISFDLKPSVNGSVSFSAFMNGNATNSMSASVTTLQGNLIANEWNHCIMRTTTKSSFDDITVGSQLVYMSLSASLRAANTWTMMKNIKVEEGSIATPWCPNSSDALATTMGLNSTTEYDCSGFCNNGTRTGTFTWISDTPKYAVSQYFNGSSYILTNSGSFSWFNFDKCTIAAWMKPTITPSGYTGSIGISHDSGASNKAFCISNYGGKFTVNSANGNYVNTQSTYTLPLNEWHHCVATLDGTTVNMYVDGVLNKTFTIDWGSTTVLSSTFAQVGVDMPGSNEIYTGYYADVRIYATALSANDVKSLYQNCATIDPDGTIRGQIRS